MPFKLFLLCSLSCCWKDAAQDFNCWMGLVDDFVSIFFLRWRFRALSRSSVCGRLFGIEFFLFGVFWF